MQFTMFTRTMVQLKVCEKIIEALTIQTIIYHQNIANQANESSNLDKMKVYSWYVEAEFCSKEEHEKIKEKRK